MSKNVNPTPVMKGGAKEYMMDIVKKQWSPIEVYILIILGLGIVFVREIPLRVRRTAESFLGRIVLFSVSVLLTMHSPWINGILFVIFSLLLLSMSPRSSEGFNNCSTSVKVVDDKKLWFVEALLKERPKIIEDDEVKTSAIQDGANSSRSTGGGAAP
jgi:hypothetical protein